MIIEKTGTFMPARLALDLRAAGVDCQGVTCTEDATGAVTAVQIICADGTDTATVDAVCASHDPATITAAAEADTVAAAWTTIRDIRDRWLDASQIVFDVIATPGSHDLPASMTDAIAANSQAWLDWRDAMRALPDQKSLDPLATAAAAPTGSTSDTWGSPWPQPPAAPIRRL